MATTVKTFTSSGNWTCPPGVTSVKVEIRAPGGGSGGLTTDTFAIGGGAGGQYVIKNAFSVTPGTTYTVTIGNVGSAGSATGPTAGGTGGDTWFSSNDANGVVAKGGAGSSGNSRTGAAGSTTGGVGDVVYKGGDGGTSSGTTGGGGGEGGCSDKNGGSGGAPTAGSGGDGGDGGTGASNGVGGAPSTYGGGGGGSASTSTTNRAGRAGAAGNIVITYTTPLAESLTDNFDDNSINSALWAQYTASGGSISETGQQMVLSLANTTAGSNGNLYSANTYVVETQYDLTGSSIIVEVPQVTGGADTYSILSFEPDSNNKLKLQYRSSTGNIEAFKRVSGSDTTLATVVYNSTTMRWWRLRELGGKTYWDYSADSKTWINFYNVTNPITVTSGTINFIAYENSSSSSPGAVNFDNLNLPTAADNTNTLTDNFDDNSEDSSKWGNAYSSTFTTKSETGGELVITMTTITAGVNYAGYKSTYQYNLTGSEVYVNIPTMCNTGTNAVAYLKLSLDEDSYLIFIQEAGTLYAKKCVGGTTSTVSSVVYNSTNHAWLKIRESSGTIYWDVSSDGTSYSNLTSTAKPFTVKNLYAEMGGGTYQSEVNPGAIHFENFNVAPASATAVKDLIGIGIIPFGR